MVDAARMIRGINLPGLATIAVCLAVWEFAVRGGGMRYDYLPAPSAIAASLVDLAVSGQLAADGLQTLEAVLAGWAVAMALGVSLGLALGASPTLRSWSLASIEVLRPMPGIAFVPVALLLFGFSLQTELMIIVLPALWPVLINTMGGVTAVHARLHDVGRTLRLRRGTIIAKILLPAALPAILVGARLSLTLALVLAVVAEMVGNPSGLGYAVVREQQALRPDLMFAYVVAIGCLAILLNGALVTAAALFPAAAGRPEAGR
jgi:ABC-type nitrate/sulfonate/bicarbonate transport system permease component